MPDTHVELPSFCCAIVTAPQGGDAYAYARRALPAFEAIRAEGQRIELSDDPRSREARVGALGLLICKVTEMLLAGRPVAVDATGLRDDQLNQLARQVGRAYAVPIRLRAPGPREADPRVVLTRSATDRSEDAGPFDIVGDVHGCTEELLHLLSELGYRVEDRIDREGRRFSLMHPEGRRLVFLGDLADRGPDPIGALSLALDACETGMAHWTIGNHDAKLLQHLSGSRASPSHGFAETATAVDAEPPGWRARLLSLLERLPSHLVLDGGGLVAVHAGCPEALQGRDSHALTSFCMYGMTTGEMDAQGRPIRGDWAADYRGRAFVVHGHTPHAAPRWGGGGKVLCLDTGCCFGGALTAWRWPERELVSVPALRSYSERDLDEVPSSAPSGIR